MPADLDATQIIKAPLITEKLTTLTDNNNVYGFKVDRRANKVQIKKAVEQLFGVRVVSVNTMTRKGKPRRVRFSWGHAPTWKRALVKLAEGDRIE